jgi:hypothetical protein
MEARQVSREPVHVLARQGPARQEHVGAALVRQEGHLHRPVDDLAFAIEVMTPAIVAPHRHHPPVHLGRQPAIERHLGLAGPPPLLERGEVQEPEVHRLLHLEHPLRRAKHARRRGSPSTPPQRDGAGERLQGSAGRL